MRTGPVTCAQRARKRIHRHQHLPRKRNNIIVLKATGFFSCSYNYTYRMSSFIFTSRAQCTASFRYVCTNTPLRHERPRGYSNMRIYVEYVKTFRDQSTLQTQQRAPGHAIPVTRPTGFQTEADVVHGPKVRSSWRQSPSMRSGTMSC
jgi:hypothetical protein